VKKEAEGKVVTDFTAKAQRALYRVIACMHENAAIAGTFLEDVADANQRKLAERYPVKEPTTCAHPAQCTCYDEGSCSHCMRRGHSV
jgi:hypothetical protein